ncbi:hypothetical protein [Corallococcus sp. EGB]|uniref:hypothetical protein n=1 Tax=Corallococcus sp. EGB TaxID=1521117 RepID=UPI001CBBD5DF|nr:hypothetical protein [Corallococcus sp. EGB]
MATNELAVAQHLGTSAQYVMDESENKSSLALTKSGNVGIGTDNPYAMLHVVSTSPDLGEQGQPTQLLLQNLHGGETCKVNLQFQTYAAQNGKVSPTGGITAEDDGSYSSHLIFSTKNPGLDTNALMERLRITSGGLVGIGTNLPQVALDVNGTVRATGLSVNGAVSIQGGSLTIKGIPSARNAPGNANLQTLFVDASTGILYAL